MSFEDVEPSSALAPGILRAVSLGIFTETEPGRFSPRQIMSRVNVAAPLVRLWQALGRSCPQEGSMLFDDVGPEARADVACLYALGITQGTTATTFSPDRSVTRAEMASLLIRLWRLTGRDCPAEAAFGIRGCEPETACTATASCACTRWGSLRGLPRPCSRLIGYSPEAR